MNIDFTLVLFILVLVSGVIWLIDAVFFAKSRSQKFREYLSENKIAEEAVLKYETRETEDKATLNQKIIKQLHTAYEIKKDPGLVEYSKSFFPILFAVLAFRSFLFEPFKSRPVP